MRAAFTMTAKGGMLGLISLATASAADAQRSDLATMLEAGVPCTIGDAARYLSSNVYRSPASTRDLIAALNELAIDMELCAPIRSAASDQAASLSETGLAVDPVDAAIARDRIVQTFQEAETHAGSMRFEVGPPPRNLTRGKGGGS